MSDFNMVVQGIAGPLTIEADHQIIETMRAWAAGEPVWTHDQIIERWGADFLMYRIAWAKPLPSGWEKEDIGASVERTRVMYDTRRKAISEFGYSIPCAELLDELERCQPIVEIGAGSGYMTLLMRHRGIDVAGTDSGIGHPMIELAKYDPAQWKMPGKHAVRHFRDRTVFCSWPSLQETWFRQALRAMRIGQKAIVIEEDACCEQSTWDYRDAAFEQIAHIPLPAWPMLNDRAAAWIKKREVAIRKADLWRDERNDGRYGGLDTGDEVDGEAVA